MKIRTSFVSNSSSSSFILFVKRDCVLENYLQKFEIDVLGHLGLRSYQLFENDCIIYGYDGDFSEILFEIFSMMSPDLNDGELWEMVEIHDDIFQRVIKQLPDSECCGFNPFL